MRGLTRDQLVEKLDQSFSRFFTILNTHEALRQFIRMKHDEFLKIADDQARAAIDKILEQHGDIHSAKVEELLPTFARVCVAVFPAQRNRLWLIGSVSAFEVYFKDNIEAVLRHSPELIDEKFRRGVAPHHKQMKALDRFSEKLDFLEYRLAIKFNDKDFTREQLEEIQVRRNMFVHHDGHVTDQYLTRVKRTKYKKGDILDLSNEDCGKSGKCLAQAALHLHMSLLEKFSNSSDRSMTDYSG